MPKSSRHWCVLGGCLANTLEVGATLEQELMDKYDNHQSIVLHLPWAFKASVSGLPLLFLLLLFFNDRIGSIMIMETHAWSLKLWFHAEDHVCCCICMAWIHVFRTHKEPLSLPGCWIQRWGHWDLEELRYLSKVMRIVHASEEVSEPVNEEKRSYEKQQQQQQVSVWCVGGYLMESSRIFKSQST